MKGLNPYSTGSWVAGLLQRTEEGSYDCLNPYSTGSWVAGYCQITLMLFT